MNGQQTRLTLNFITGVNENGENIIRSKSFTNVKGDATDESLVAVVNALQSLQVHSLDSVTRTNSYSLN
ncbi:DUF1659 domain-containing protein [Halalkalibacter urbisdiaboli]|uniref:DUF1659 domain-containing protein n=1 Tax=Halalkalibacter urbisdiaboli TaxID=1960589 RepID=UPI0013FDFCF1|nr:DUF1659 domain-containing protein [Halalkalibacter urbisdiaboli]